MAGQFGKASYESKKKDYVRDIKLQVPDTGKGETVTHLVARIVPPMKSLKNDETGWCRYIKFHYGHKGVGNVPGTPVSRPFMCIEQMDFKTKQVHVRCPKCDQMAEYSARLDALLAQPRNADTDSEIKFVKEWLKFNYLSKGYRMYVVTSTGEICRLQVTSTARKDLLTFIKKCQVEENVNVIDADEGVYIDFMRSGFGRDTRDTFAIATTQIDLPQGGKAKVNMKAPISDELEDRIIKTCPDLAVPNIATLSAAQIQALVDSDGSPEETDRIFYGDHKPVKSTAAPGRPEAKVDMSSPVSDDITEGGMSEDEFFASISR